MSITTYYQHNLRRDMAIFAGWHMSYAGRVGGVAAYGQRLRRAGLRRGEVVR